MSVFGNSVCTMAADTSKKPPNGFLPNPRIPIRDTVSESLEMYVGNKNNREN